MIKLTNIHQTYQTQTVLNDLNLDVGANSFVRIKGASGSGKSTILHIIAGLKQADQGQVHLNDKLASNPRILIPPNEREVSLLFQDLALWPHMTGYENLSFVLGNTAGVEDKISTVCQQIAFPKELLKYPAQLSGGEQQRLAIARAVIAEKKILLLDEPFTSLDEDLRNQFTEYLNQLVQQRDRTIILVSHDLVADQVKPDQAYQLQEGKLVEI